ncbi:MAG: type III pantothenate kinase [candidate division FCPU426 bacterium]
MLIVMDVGNTHMCFGVYQGSDLLREFRVSTNRKATADELGVLLRGLLHGVHGAPVWEGVVIASVVPEMDLPLTEAVQRQLRVPVLSVTPDMPLPIRNAYRPPEAVGADRLMNAVAAVNEFGAPVLIVDFGTATTIDAVARGRVYQGGAIMPGLLLSADALSRGTALLPRVELRPPSQALGRNTEESLQSGILLGAAGAVSKIVADIRRRWGQRVPVVATGGLASLVRPFCPVLRHHRPHLTLEGLRLTWLHHSRRSGRR